MASGRVKWFDSKKGFGFIEAAELEKDVFVHHSGIAGDGYHHLKEGDQVEFELEETEKGPQAVNVRLTEAAAPEDPAPEAAASEDPAQSDSSAPDAES